MGLAWKSTHQQDQHDYFHASLSPNIGFSFSFFLATNVILFLINFHDSFFLLDIDAVLYITCKAISPISKLFHIEPVFMFHESSNKEEFLKFTLKQQTDYYLINYLCPNLIPKYYLYFTVKYSSTSTNDSIASNSWLTCYHVAAKTRENFHLKIIFLKRT